LSGAATVNEAGTYQVLVSYTPGTNRSTKAAIVVPTEDGDKTIVLDQQPRPAGPYSFQPSERAGAGS
jgi:hypothetical protein